MYFCISLMKRITSRKNTEQVHLFVLLFLFVKRELGSPLPTCYENEARDVAVGKLAFNNVFGYGETW